MLPPRREAQNREISFLGFLKMAFPSRREAHFREIRSPVSVSVFLKWRSRLDGKLIFEEMSFSCFFGFGTVSGIVRGVLFEVFWAPFGHHFGALGLSWEVFWASLRTSGSAGAAF